MSNPTPKNESENIVNVSPWRCLLGALISGSLAYGLYFLTASIAHSFATKPVTSNNVFTLNIAIAVRTLVVGTATLGTGVFSLVAFSLILLAIQVTFQQLKQKSIGN